MTEGPTDLKVTWQFSKSQLITDDRRNILANNTLIITKADVDDTGEYKCIAQSPNSVASASVYVNVVQRKYNLPTVQC